MKHATNSLKSRSSSIVPHPHRLPPELLDRRDSLRHRARSPVGDVDVGIVQSAPNDDGDHLLASRRDIGHGCILSGRLHRSSDVEALCDPPAVRHNAQACSMMYGVEIGRYVLELRTQQGLSLRDLAARSDVSPTALSQVERGEASPSVVTASRIATGLGMTLSQLVRLDEAPPLRIVRAARPRAGRRRTPPDRAPHSATRRRGHRRLAPHARPGRRDRRRADPPGRLA